jgi:hypothetical protein
MNLDFAKQIAAHCGAIIVDSTRRGKRFPDSMNATVSYFWRCTVWLLSSSARLLIIVYSFIEFAVLIITSDRFQYGAL